jgi:hypothetical protein
MGHHTNTFDPNAENFSFGGRLKTMCLAFMAIGVVGMLWAFFDTGEAAHHHSRFWTNLLTNAYYFNGIAIVAMFLVSALTLGYGAWQTIIKRVFESFGVFVWVTFVCFLLIIIGMKLGWHNLYDHWLNAPATDMIVADKKAFLNFTSYTVGVLFFFAGWLGIGMYMRKHSIAEDMATDPIAHFQKSKYISAAYIVLFGVSSSIFSWWAIMSLDPHWYSTMFGWYNFASYMCGMLSMMILVLSYLKYKGHLNNVNENHLHDIGKFLFGFSVFWTYVWFSQFMLIWYGNIPEDTMYFRKRFDIPLFKVLFFVNLLINFVFPFFYLMKRKSKRSFLIAGFAASVLIVGHYIDYYLMVAVEPNAIEHHTGHDAKEAHADASKVVLLAQHNAAAAATEAVKEVVKEEVAHEATTAAHTVEATATEAHATEVHTEAAHTDAAHHTATDAHATEHAAGAHHEEAPLTYATLGLIEAMIFLGFFGAFLFVVFTTLAKNRLVPINHPMLDESLRHNI